MLPDSVAFRAKKWVGHAPVTEEYAVLQDDAAVPLGDASLWEDHFCELDSKVLNGK
jgi:hypothetical protein